MITGLAIWLVVGVVVTIVSIIIDNMAGIRGECNCVGELLGAYWFMAIGWPLVVLYELFDKDSGLNKLVMKR